MEEIVLKQEGTDEPAVKVVVDPESGTLRVKELYPVAKDVNAADLEFYQQHVACSGSFGEDGCSLTRTRTLYENETFNVQGMFYRRMGEGAMAQAYEKLVSKKLSSGTFSSDSELWTIEDQEELKDIENMLIARLGYRKQCIELRFTQRLSEKEFDTYRDLCWDKYASTVEGWSATFTDDDKEKHRSLTRKILNPSESRIEKVARARNALKEDDRIMFSRVRLKNDACMKAGSAGKIGTGGICYPWHNEFQYRILLDIDGIGNPFVHCNYREDIEMLCSLCDKSAAKKGRCQGCNYAWYCSTECQHKHWKVHKKLCKKNRPNISLKLLQTLKVDDVQHQDLLLKYIAASKIDSTTEDAEAFQCKCKHLIDSVVE
mmetsp:Transcript_15950/g.39517  ORF Transcript_15950/g.39517 Transcript_15950/m.39517 type:complete len:374 (-) Transcript_15950:1410-2531(-)|eukprot:CAMPEP_0113446770 /NCGR_PEP_ID=MMETSP0014_2-20120614/3887_1 /TAXON_ID=2857 /ORGANISM="Nitzschia sp." /LENGTH=373 /DNA_ID=CAMNT_0000337891 /DNA_START=154 /DNA_END=1275 /DNA_ORIENTATION=+ /assembly_acc=CAM_ASM_000159